MHTPSPLLLTLKDYQALEFMVRTCPDDEDTLARALARKLSQVRIIAAHDMPEDIVTIDSHVRFDIDGAYEHERTLVLPQDYVPDDRYISVATLRGLSLLGLKQGQSTAISHDGRIERLHLLQVLYQPEAHRHVSSL